MFETTNQIYIYIDELSSNIIDSPYLLVKILVSFSAKKGALEKAFTQVSTEQIELKLGKSPSWYNHQITRKQKTQFYQNTYSNRFLKPVVHGIFPLNHIPSGKLTWTLKISHFEWKPVFQPLFARVYVNLPEGITIQIKPVSLEPQRPGPKASPVQLVNSPPGSQVFCEVWEDTMNNWF